MKLSRRGPVVPLTRAAARKRLRSLPPGWRIRRGRLVREFRFPDFRAALAFANRAGAAAERANHHPELRIGWGRAVATIWTHSVNALTPSDFALAEAISAAEEPAIPAARPPAPPPPG